MGRLLVHLLEVGYPLLGHSKASAFVGMRSRTSFSETLLMESPEVRYGAS
jgi:hypothetical protein